MNFENKKNDFVYSKVVKAGSRRTYFIDVKSGKREDYCIIITESRKMSNYDSDRVTYEKNKIFLYKEDFNKFINGLNEVVDHVKTELLPDYDFETFDKPRFQDGNTETVGSQNTDTIVENANTNTKENNSKEEESEW